jgi:hypothetical protein
VPTAAALLQVGVGLRQDKVLSRLDFGECGGVTAAEVEHAVVTDRVSGQGDQPLGVGGGAQQAGVAGQQKAWSGRRPCPLAAAGYGCAAPADDHTSASARNPAAVPGTVRSAIVSVPSPHFAYTVERLRSLP